MAFLKETKLEEDVVEDGTWFRFHEDIEFKLAPMSNKKFQKAIAKSGTSARSGFREGSEVASDLDGLDTQRKVVRYLVKDWRSDKGEHLLPISEEETVEFSVDEAIRILTDPGYQICFKWIVEQTGEQAEFAAGTLRERAKN